MKCDICTVRNYYLDLGLKDFSSAEVAKKKYRRLAKIYHPDKNQNNPEFTAKFQKIVKAYEVISSPEQKLKLDQFLSGKFHLTRQKTAEERIAEARLRSNEIKARAIEERFDRYENSWFKIKVRLLLAYFLMSVCFFLFVFNYFPNFENSFSTFLIAFLVLFYASLIYLMVDSYYLKQAFMKRRNISKLNELLKKTTYLFLVLFFGTPILGSITANLRKDFLLNRETLTVQPKELDINRTNGSWRVRFMANYQWYSCYLDASELHGVKKENIVVEYYPGDPRICKLSKKRK